MSRKVVEQIRAQAASDGAGVKLLRVFGGAGLERFDPFLMLDEFGSEEASDYIAGFPPHPHRGFSTVTYMLQGKMEHRDHLDNVGLLQDGGVQWMNAGRGIIHSEMPKQTEGNMRGFQFWLNLPASKKMSKANYRDIPAEEIRFIELSEGKRVKAIAGTALLDGKELKGFFDIEDTQALILDLHLFPGKSLDVSISDSLNTMMYIYDGEVLLSEAQVPAKAQTLTRFNGQGVITIKNASDSEARVICMAGLPLKEPIVQHGPFVMNTVEELEQAIRDFQNGQLTE